MLAKYLILCSFIFILSQEVSANNIRLKKFSLSDTVRTAKSVNIKFDLSWDNSWRDDINWDATWITAKVKRANGTWKHIKFQSTGNLITTNPQNAKIVVPEDKMGLFLYRSANGNGSIDLSGIKLSWNYGADSVANIDSAEVRLFATEMVYIPQGSFAFGDSYTPSATNFQLPGGDRIIQAIFKNFIMADTVKYGRNTPMFAVVTDKTTPKLSNAGTNSGPMNAGDQVILDGIYINGLKGIGISPSAPFKYPDFPTGYKAFYTMKYEVTQGQYTDFLNTTKIISNQFTQVNHLPIAMSPNNPLSRFSIEKQGETFIVSRPDRAMDYVDAHKVFAFSNWSSLRPMTELEFEKSARGSLAPVFNDRATGESIGNFAMPGDNSNSKLINTLKISGAENGAEVPLAVDSTKSLSSIISIEGGDGGTGAYRVGVFATATSSRRSSGASYYGVMGLTDNVGELVLPLSSEAARKFNGATGVGENNINGQPPTAHWNITTQPNYYQFFSLKGSGPVSSRDGIYSDKGGFRLVRSAPENN